MPYKIPEFRHFPHVIPDASTNQSGTMSPSDKAKLDSLPTSNGIDLSGSVAAPNGASISVGGTYTPAIDGVYVIQYIGMATESSGNECATWEGPLFSTWHRASGVVTQLGAAPSVAPTKRNGGDTAAWTLQNVFGGPSNAFSFTAFGGNVGFGVDWRVVATVYFIGG